MCFDRPGTPALRRCCRVLRRGGGKGGQAVGQDQQLAEARVEERHDPDGRHSFGLGPPPDEDGDGQADHVRGGVAEPQTGGGQPAALRSG